MSRKKTIKVVSNISVGISTILAWLSGFFVMQIVYDSLAASIIFGTIVAIIVFCESRFSNISLKSDGRITISKEEVKSNFMQILAAFCVAVLVAVPLELKIFASQINSLAGSAEADLGTQIKFLGDLFSTQWLPIVLIGIAVIAIFQVSIFMRMISDE